MKKFLTKRLLIFNILFLSIFFSQNISFPCFAQEKNANLSIDYNDSVKKESDENIKELNAFIAEYIKALNARNIKKAGNYYAANYTDSDGFNKEQLINLLKQAWQKYPDIKYSSTVKALRFSGNSASIELCYSLTATTKAKSDITKDTGALTGVSQETIYLEKYDGGWKIVTNKILYEEVSIKYGIAKNINLSLNVPEQVLSGEEYTASLKTDLPPDVFALGSITSAPIVFPLKSSEEVFKQIPPDLNILERVIKSNKNSLNEISSASVSFCEAQSGSYTGINLRVAGVAVILKRVNILPSKS